MLVAVAVCPHPPLLVPAVAAGAAAELDHLRASCAEAVHRLLAAGPDVVCIVGSGPAQQWYGDGDSGTLRPYGVPLDVPLQRATGRPPALPLSLTVGAWLLNGASWPGERRALAVPAAVCRDDLSRLAGDVAGLGRTVGMLVMGDGSARRSEQAPGYVDPRAVGFDDGVATALATADTAALTALDARLAGDLLAAGSATWRLLGHAGAGADWQAELLLTAAPYGVAYFVATWIRR